MATNTQHATRNTSVDQLLTDLQNGDWQVRWRAAEALAEYNDDRVAQALQEVLRDRYWEVRHAAVAGLAGQKDGAKRALALQALADPMYWVQKAADDVLQQFHESGDLDAQPALRALFNDWRQPAAARAAAREALAKIEEAWGGVSRGAIAVAAERAGGDGAITVAEAENGKWKMENGNPEAEMEESEWKQAKEPWWKKLWRR